MMSAVVTIVMSSLITAQAGSASSSNGAAQAGTVPPKIESFLKLCETSRRGSILQLEHTLRGLRADGSKSAETQHRIAKTEANLRALRANKEPVVPALKFPPEVGAIGRLPRLSCHVDQILSENEMLVRCFFSLKVTSVRHFQAEGEIIVRPVTFLLRGLPTGALHEGSELELLQVFEITGTHRYKTAQGRLETVLVLSEFDMEAVEPFFRATAARP